MIEAKEAWLECGGTRLLADASGALVWPEQGLVVVADLHLEKGSSFARRGSLLPPYDTRSTLARLEDVLARHHPRRVISLGDGFHDPGASARLSPQDRDRLRALIGSRDWLWICGNHDPDPPLGLGGACEAAAEIAGLTFRHCPSARPVRGEIAGHLHPKATVTIRGRRVSRPCFVGDRTRSLLPAFGSYTGGLDVGAPAIARLFTGGCAIRLLGRSRVYLVPNALLSEPGAPLIQNRPACVLDGRTDEGR
jgi:uncharacterized protein